MFTRFISALALVAALLAPATAGATGTKPLSEAPKNQPPAPANRSDGAAAPAAAPLASAPAASTPVTISGSVTDANGLPLAGATVWVVGHLRQMSVTNAEGDFTLTLPARTPVQLSYAAVGYQNEVVLLPRPSRLTMPAISLLAAGTR